MASRDQQTPEALYAYQKAEIEKWWSTLKTANIEGEYIFRNALIGGPETSSTGEAARHPIAAELQRKKFRPPTASVEQVCDNNWCRESLPPTRVVV